MQREPVLLGMEADRFTGFHAFEAEAYARGFQLIAGIDEVGRGPLAGPVLAGAVVLPRGYSHCEIKDSKLLSDGQRKRVAVSIRESAVAWALGIVHSDEIDEINIHQASLLAMVKALAGLGAQPDCALIDGNQSIPMAIFRMGQFVAGRTVYQKTIVKGDRSCVSIAAASIIAKVARDAMMVEYDELYPAYGFAEHKGYGCADHLESLRRYGPSPIHRRSFKPVRESLPQQANQGPLFKA